MESRQKYVISETEINRRKRAFTSLIVSIFLSLSLSLKLFLNLSYPSLFLTLLVLAAFLFVCRFFMEKAFKSFSEITLVLTDEYIERLTPKENEKIHYTDIDGVSFKRTIHDSTREIKINTKIIYLTENFYYIINHNLTLFCNILYFSLLQLYNLRWDF